MKKIFMKGKHDQVWENNDKSKKRIKIGFVIKKGNPFLRQ
jgi:hypothetical protein